MPPPGRGESQQNYRYTPTMRSPFCCKRSGCGPLKLIIFPSDYLSGWQQSEFAVGPSLKLTPVSSTQQDTWVPVTWVIRQS